MRCQWGSARAAFIEFYEFLKESPLVTIVPASQALFEQGMDLFSHRPDKHWTLTDCLSFVVMKAEAITDALTGDRHFEQAGFKPLFK